MSSDGPHTEAGLGSAEKIGYEQKTEYEPASSNNNNSDGDHEAAAARGAQLDDIPAGYWWSFRFLGSAFSIVLLAASLFVNFNLPVGLTLSE